MARRRGLSGNSLEILTGAVVIALLGVLMTWAYTVGGGGGTGYSLTARFGQIDGLAVGAEVQLAGIRIGTVTAERYDAETDQAVVTLGIDSDIALPEDSSASVVSDGLLGGKFVSLGPGGALDMLADGDEIGYVQNAVLFDRVLQRIVRAAEAKRAKEKDTTPE